MYRNRFTALPLAAAASLLSLTGIAGITATRADVTLPALFTPDMVLQRETDIPVWGKADPGEKVTVTLQDRTADTTAGSDGKWMLRLKPVPAGGPYVLTVAGKNTLTVPGVLVGEVWICSGQSNMEFPLSRAANAADAIPASADPMLHLFHVPKVKSDTPLTDVKSKWVVCGPTTVTGFTAVGYFFGRDLRKALGVPVGLIESDWGGTTAQAWTREEILDGDDYLKKNYVDNYHGEYSYYQKQMAAYPDAVDKAKADGKPEPKKPNAPWKHSELYNGMIAPLTPYAIRGATWYQGESNTGNAAGYQKLLPAMIQDWRDDFQVKDFPFLIVQLAPYGNGGGKNLNYAQLRESQYVISQKMKNVGLAVITDVGDQGNIHPTRKEPDGIRLALLARKIAYGEDIVAMGPTFKKVEFTKDKAIVTFDNVGDGLDVRGGDASGVPVTADKLTGFTISNDGKTWIDADAKVTGKDTVEVSLPEVPNPTSVRYGFVNFPVVNLWNKNGLPACPFRSDMP